MKNTRLLVTNALIAAVYAAWTILMAPISYGAIQARLSEIMVFLAFYNKKFIPGLAIGCILANIPSSLGVIDMVFGTISTILVCFAMYYLPNRYAGAVAGGIITGLIIGFELHMVFQLPFIISALEVFAGEVIVLAIGAVIFGLIERNSGVMNYIKEKE